MDERHPETAKDRVRDDEVLYRRVQAGRNYYEVAPFSRQVTRISSQAFNDRGYKPSVDRAELREHDPARSQHEDTDAVLKLLTADIRSIPPVPERKDNKSAVNHELDVVPDPIRGHPDHPDNPAHALIIPNPAFRKTKPKKVFRRVKEALARLAMEEGCWAILPVELRWDR